MRERCWEFGVRAEGKAESEKRAALREREEEEATHAIEMSLVSWAGGVPAYAIRKAASPAACYPLEVMLCHGICYVKVQQYEHIWQHGALPYKARPPRPCPLRRGVIQIYTFFTHVFHAKQRRKEKRVERERSR